MQRALHKKSNPTHGSYGSGWMLQILSTMSHPYEGGKSHQRELVDGSDPFYRDTLDKNFQNPTNGSWWIVSDAV
jgi:hypothetical protein